jgi:hypothetical protein
MMRSLKDCKQSISVRLNGTVFYACLNEPNSRKKIYGIIPYIYKKRKVDVLGTTKKTPINRGKKN